MLLSRLCAGSSSARLLLAHCAYCGAHSAEVVEEPGITLGDGVCAFDGEAALAADGDDGQRLRQPMIIVRVNRRTTCDAFRSPAHDNGVWLRGDIRACAR